MPVIFHPGQKVPNRKPKYNPETITGRPPLNTYQGLGMPSAMRELNRAVRADNLDALGQLVMKGKRSRCKTKPAPAPGNLFYRAHEREDRAWGHFINARALSFAIDRKEPGTKHHQVLMKQYVDCIRALLDLDKSGAAKLKLLQSKELARGCNRAFHVIRNLNS